MVEPLKLNLRSENGQSGLFGTDDDGASYFETRQPVKCDDGPFDPCQADRPTRAAPVRIDICVEVEPDAQGDLF